MGRTKWTYHKERSLANNSTLTFLKNLFHFKNLLKRADLMKRWSFIGRGFCHVSSLKHQVSDRIPGYFKHHSPQP